MTRPQCRHSRLARVHPRMGRDCGYVRVSGPLAGDVRGAQVRCASVSDHERLRAFTSIYERLRAFASAPSRVWSRLVAPFFFVRALLGVFCHIVSYLVVIFRHFSSFFVQNGFPGMAGNGRLRQRLGREGSSLLRMVPAPGAGCASCHDIRFKIGMQLRQVRGCVRSSYEQLYYGIEDFTVPGLRGPIVIVV